MRDTRISLLLLLSFILLLASFLVLSIWGYRIYNKAETLNVKVPAPAILPSDIGRDSLLKLYTYTLQNLETKLGATYSTSDSVESSLQVKLDEYYRLKNEISQLLLNPASDADFEKAKIKIDELQQKMQVLRRTNYSVSAENEKLHDLLEKMKENNISNKLAVNTTYTSEVEEPATQVRTASKVEAPVKEANNAVSPKSFFSTTDLRLEKIAGYDKSEFVGSFALKNNGGGATIEDLMIVVVQPDGKVLQKSPWESGTFQTQYGKKIYSCKMRVENSRGEVRKLTFSISTATPQQGIYTLQVFHKGILIGNISRKV